MRIGLFTDTFRPSINGIVYVIESTKRHLEEMGHEVFVICPGKPLKSKKDVESEINLEDDNILRFRSVKGIFYDDYDISLFFPPRAVNKVIDLELDVIHIFTPSQVGMLGLYASFKANIPIVTQHSTDLYEYVDHYPATLPGILALLALVPFSMKLKGKDTRELLKLYRPRKDRIEWAHDVIETAITFIYSRCDAVVALSKKSEKQLKSWQDSDEEKYEITLLPNGVDALAEPSTSELEAFRSRWSIGEDDKVVTFVGRLGEEKNLDKLIPMIEKVTKEIPNSKLMFVGDFEYREQLEAKAADSPASNSIIFTGAIPRERLGVAYHSSSLFAFPSLKDTQGWVLHEAAHAGLPIVMIDRELSVVMKDGENGYFADDNSDDLAKKVISILSDNAKYNKFSKKSQELAQKYTEQGSAEKLVEVYKKIIKNKTS